MPCVLFPDPEFYILGSIFFAFLFLFNPVIFSPAFLILAQPYYRKLYLLIFRFMRAFDNSSMDRVNLVLETIHFLYF